MRIQHFFNNYFAIFYLTSSFGVFFPIDILLTHKVFGFRNQRLNKSDTLLSMQQHHRVELRYPRNLKHSLRLCTPMSNSHCISRKSSKLIRVLVTPPEMLLIHCIFLKANTQRIENSRFITQVVLVRC